MELLWKNRRTVVNDICEQMVWRIFLRYVLKMLKSEKRDERSLLKQMEKNLIESVKDNSQRRFWFLNVSEKRKVFRKGTEKMLTLKDRHQKILSSSFWKFSSFHFHSETKPYENLLRSIEIQQLGILTVQILLEEKWKWSQRAHRDEPRHKDAQRSTESRDESDSNQLEENVTIIFDRRKALNSSHRFECTNCFGAILRFSSPVLFSRHFSLIRWCFTFWIDWKR